MTDGLGQSSFSSTSMPKTFCDTFYVNRYLYMILIYVTKYIFVKINLNKTASNIKGFVNQYQVTVS